MRVVRGSPEDLTNFGATYGSVFPAIELMMLAARALGVGTAMTTMLSPHEAETKALLGVPDLYQLIALILMGYRPRTSSAHSASQSRLESTTVTGHVGGSDDRKPAESFTEGKRAPIRQPRAPERRPQTRFRKSAQHAAVRGKDFR